LPPDSEDEEIKKSRHSEGCSFLKVTEETQKITNVFELFYEPLDSQGRESLKHLESYKEFCFKQDDTIARKSFDFYSDKSGDPQQPVPAWMEAPFKGYESEDK